MAIVEGKNPDYPLRTCGSINKELQIDFPMGFHRAGGGYHDFPNSRILRGALVPVVQWHSDSWGNRLFSDLTIEFNLQIQNMI